MRTHALLGVVSSKRDATVDALGFRLKLSATGGIEASVG
jgi:hypothetical protein